MESIVTNQETIDLDAAAGMLFMQPASVRKKAARGEIPGAKVGRSWIFIKSDLLAHIRKLTETHQGEQTTKAPTQHIHPERKAAPRTRRRTLPCLDSYMLLTQ